MTNLIIFLVAIVIAIIGGTKTKTNIGVWGIALALILGFTVVGLPATKVLANFPTTLFFNFFIACLFYGFAQANGTMMVLAKKLMYFFRNVQWMAPVTLFLSALIISACGSDITASIMLSPMAFGLALEMGFSPFVAVCGIWGGSMAVMMFPWTTTGSINFGTMLGTVDAAQATSAVYFAGATQLIFCAVEFIIICLITGAFKAKGERAVMEKPDDFNPVQKKTFIVIVISLIILVLPNIIQLIAPNGFTQWISKNIGNQVLWAVLAIYLHISKCGDMMNVMTTKVPWNTIILTCGMATMFGLASPMGVVDTMGELIKSVPGVAVAMVLGFAAAFLSFFVSGAIIGPFFIPLVPTLAAVSGVPMNILLTAVVAGSGVSSVSPVSQGGASALTGCPTEELRSKMMGRQMTLAIINAIIYPLYLLLLTVLFK